MRSTLIFLVVLAVSSAFADRLTFRNGQSVSGTYLGGDARSVRLAVGDRVETYAVADVAALEFGEVPATRVAESEPVTPPARAESPTPEPPAGAGSIPAGTEVVVRMIDDVDSDVARVGQTFRASVDEPVMVGSTPLISRGADVTVKLVEDKQAGKLTGRTELTLTLVSVVVDGKTLDATSEEVVQASESRSKKTAKVVGGTTALGAVIGAIAGGGKGAAVGAVTGAAAGGAVQVFTKGERVKIPSETRLSFKLKNPLWL
jgi:hypothetical protein